MRLHRRAYLARGLSVATVAAVLALAATGDAEAQRRGGFGFSGSRMNMGAQRQRPMMMRQHRRDRAARDRRQDGQSQIRFEVRARSVGSARLARKSAATNPGKDGGRKPPKGPVVGEKHAGARRRPSAALARPLSAPRLGAAGCDRHRRGDRHRSSRSARSAPPPPPPSGGPAGPQISLAAGRRHQHPAAERKPLRAERSGARIRRQFPPQAIIALAQRHRLARLDSVSLQSTGTTFFRARIVDGRPVRVVLAGLRREVQLRAGQPNYLYAASQQAGERPATFTPPAASTPAATPVAAAAGALAGARRRSGAIRAGQAAAAGGAQPDQRQQHPGRGDRFRRRRRPSRAARRDRRHVRCAGQGREAAHARHRDRRRDRRPLAADGRGARRAHPGDPRVRRLRQQRRGHHLRHHQGHRPRDGAERPRHQHELRRSRRSGPGAAARRRARARHRAGRRRRQFRRQVAAAISRRRSQRDRGLGDRRRGQAVHRVEPWRPHRGRGAGRGHPGAGARRQLPRDLRHLGRGGPCQRRRWR